MRCIFCFVEQKYSSFMNRSKRTKAASKKKPRNSKTVSSNGVKTRTPGMPLFRNRAKLRSVAGLLIFAAGVLFFLAILTYSQSDPVLSSNVPGNDYRTHNVLGIVGATIAQPVFVYFFGYASLIFPILMMLYGIYILMEQPLNKLARFTALGLGWAYFVSIVLALPESLQTLGHSFDYYPSGLVGGATADLIVRFMGRFALGFLTVIYLLVLLILTFEFQVAAFPKMVAGFFRDVANEIADFLQHISRFANRIKQSVMTVLFHKTPETDTPDPDGPEIKTYTVSTSDNRSGIYDDSQREISLNDDFQLDNTPSTELLAPADLQKAHPVDEPASTSENRDIPIIRQSSEAQTSPTELEFPKAGKPFPDEMIAPPKSAPIIDELEMEKPGKPAFHPEYDNMVAEAASKYQIPPLDLLDEDETQSKVSREELMANADRLESTLANFNVKAFVKKVIEGPVITLYAVRPAEGVKISQITNLADDLALAMKAKGIRMIAPIPGEAAIGIEIPNRKPSIVYFKSIVRSEKFQNHPGQLVLGMGKTIGGEVFCADLTRMPHLLIAGATGAGKSVGINTIIASIIYRVPPSDVKFVMIDPKKLELSLYAKLKDHYLAICPDIDETVITHPQNAILVLRAAVNEMEERYDILSKVGVRDIVSYNKKIEKYHQNGEKTEFRKLPYIVVIIDELADLILTASREVEEPITRLAQMARAVGIHLIVATQRPSVDILTGLIKANFPTRIAYQVATRPDSKTILDMYGAEKLIGNGDMLYLPPGTGKPIRLQNPFISTEEVERMIHHVRKQPKFPPYELKLTRDVPEPSSDAVRKVNQDELFEKAKEIVIRHQSGSTSLLQRKLQIGYARAGRLMDALEQAGIVGPSQGSKAREVLVNSYDDGHR